MIINEHVSVTAGLVFAASAPSGDIHPGTTLGFYAHDTRFLSEMRLTVQGREPAPVGSDLLDHSMASFYATSKGVRGLPGGSVSVARDRCVTPNGLHEDISIVNHGMRTRSFEVALRFDADFADIFEVRRGGPAQRAGGVWAEQRAGQDICLVYSEGEFRRETWISFSETRRRVEGDNTVIFSLTLAPKETWATCVSVLPVIEGTPSPTECLRRGLGAPFGAARPPAPPESDPDAEGRGRFAGTEVPALTTDHPELARAYRQAVTDLRSLLLEPTPGERILAAGLPWFMAVFGRDSIIAAIQTKLLGPGLMRGTLETLAGLQATSHDTFREADPGKIPHEVRHGLLSALERVPHSRYYGTVDATPLFLVLLWDAYQWTGDSALLKRMLPAAEAALAWIDSYGDVDGDGFIEYRRQTREGLRNQGWKDSHDSIAFADGRLAEGPIALAEAQGYVYDATMRMSFVYHALGDATKAQEAEQQAQALRERFNEAFWMPKEEFFAMALDGRKRQVDGIASNPGHCLWSGIVEPDKAAKAVDRLMAPDMFSGWGIRTLSTEMARYHPLSYHNGSVWPHDNSLIAAGMARYGFTQEAHVVAMSLIDATAAFPNARPPELFAGYPRRERSFPVPYPDANAPQAWASGAVIYLLEVLLGVIAVSDRLLQEAPQEGLGITLNGVPYRGSRRTL